MDDLGDRYPVGFGNRLGFGERPALVVVDFARAYVDQASPLYAGAESALESACRVLDAARRHGVPVIFTAVQYEQGGADGGLFYRKMPALAVFDRGSRLGELADGLATRPGEILLTKQYPSAFFGTQLSTLLVGRRIDTLVIVGVTTSGCVRATAVDAMQHGFVPVVVREAVGDRGSAPHTASLFDLQAKYADVVSEAEVIDWFASSAQR